MSPEHDQSTRFQSGNSQAVRLPKAFRFQTNEVEIFRRGNEVVLHEKPASLASVADVLPQPAEAAEHYGKIRAGLERTGAPIGPNDLWMAAHAMAEKLTLVTNNERGFRRVKGLRIANWAT